MLFLWSGYSTNTLYAQGKKISIHSENNQIFDTTTDPPTQYLNGDVKIYHAGTYMYCDTAVLRGSDLKMYFNVVLLQNDTIKIFADSLRYNGDSLVAYLYGDIILENGPSKKLYTSYLKYDVKNKIGYYTRNAKLVDNTSTLISKRGRYLLNEKTAYFYENVKVTGDDFTLVGDSLSYNTITQETKFLSAVRIIQDSSNIYSQKGWFDLDDKKGDFIGNAQYLKGNTKAKADTITYDGVLDHIILKGDTLLAEYISETDTAYAKTIFYDKQKETFRLTKEAYYKGDKNEVKGDQIFYDKVTEKFKVSGRSIVSDPPTIIEADTLDYDKAIKYGKADGHVIWRDTSAKTSIIADHLVYNGNENFMIATNDTLRPMFTTEIDGDTLFLRADTLRSFRIIKERLILPDKNAARKAQSAKNKTKVSVDFSENQVKTDTLVVVDSIDIDQDTLLQAIVTDTVFTGIMDTLDYFIGDNNVRIFKSDMQAVCDSLVFSKMDSVFTLYDQPFVWSDSTQIAGDTIDIFLRSKKMDRLTVRNQATILNTTDLKFFNQIQGRFLEAFFRESKIYKMDVNGNAQIVYYLTDKEKAYTGVNTTEAANMTFYLKDNKVTDIRNYVEPKSKVYPMKTADHEAIKVKGFKWNLDARPLSKDDL
jgi:lipopolysaccharide transport protein LptA